MPVRFEKKDNNTYLLDVRGFTCPYPVIYTKKALKTIERGSLLEVLIDNPPSCETVPNAAREEGHTVLGVEEVEAGVWKVVIKKK